MDYLHRGFTHPGGVSPMKQEEQEVTKNPKSKQEEAIDPNIVKFVNQYGPKTDESGMQGKTELSQGPDINEKIVNAITRFIAPQNTLEAGLAILPFGIGKHPGVKKLASKIFGGGTGKVIKGGVDKTIKNKGFDFAKTSKTTERVPKLQNYGKHSLKNENAMQNMLRKKSDNLDEFLKGKGPTSYNKQNTRYLGKEGGRPIYEVDLPNGETMKFYESTGWGGKVGSKGKFIPIEGTQTKVGTYTKKQFEQGYITEDQIGKTYNYEWFNKGGSKATYNNYQYKGFNDAKGNYVSVKEQLKRDGVDIAKELKSGKLKIDESGYDFQYGKAFSDISKQLENLYPSRL